LTVFGLLCDNPTPAVQNRSNGTTAMTAAVETLHHHCVQREEFTSTLKRSETMLEQLFAEEGSTPESRKIIEDLRPVTASIEVQMEALRDDFRAKFESILNWTERYELFLKKADEYEVTRYVPEAGLRAWFQERDPAPIW
jgi:hypothetical protein